VRPSSDSGTNSVPTSGRRKKLPTNTTSAMASTVLRCASAHSSSSPYLSCVHSMPRSMRPIIRAIQGKRAKRFSGGSRQIEDSIGSSVKLTKSETSTATATVMPNW